MRNSADNRKKKNISLYDLIHDGVCLVVGGYYLLKLSGIKLLERESELVLNTLFVGSGLVLLLIKVRQQKGEEGA